MSFFQIVLLVIEILKLLWDIRRKKGAVPYTQEQVQAAATRARKTGDLSELYAMRHEARAVLAKL